MMDEVGEAWGQEDREQEVRWHISESSTHLCAHSNPSPMVLAWPH